jgi:pimeloyl-ACP methyl ester carboxylesterase
VIGRGLLLIVALTALTLGIAALWVAHLESRAAKTFPPAGRFLMAEGARLHYVEAGAATDPPIILIHGNPGSVRDFDRLIPVLASGHRVIAIDRPGHGYSDRPDVRAATPTAQARQLHSALEQLGVRRPILVGHSWGGALALAYALEFPGDVAGLALLGTRAYPFDGPPDPIYTLLRRPIVGPLLSHTLAPIFARGMLEAKLAAAYHPDTLERDALDIAQALWMRPGELGAMVWDTHLLHTEAAAMAPRYSMIGIPVMLLVGDVDELLPESQQLATQLPNAWIEVVPRTGHYLPRNRVAEVQRTVAVLEARTRATTAQSVGQR